MMPVLALKKLVNWVSLTEIFCDVRSESVRAISVTLRLTATPDENSLVPKNNTSMIGTIMANSTAARPRRSSTSRSTVRRTESHIRVIGSLPWFQSLGFQSLGF